MTLVLARRAASNADVSAYISIGVEVTSLLLAALVSLASAAGKALPRRVSLVLGVTLLLGAGYIAYDKGWREWRLATLRPAIAAKIDEAQMLHDELLRIQSDDMWRYHEQQVEEWRTETMKFLKAEIGKETDKVFGTVPKEYPHCLRIEWIRLRLDALIQQFRYVLAQLHQWV